MLRNELRKRFAVDIKNSSLHPTAPKVLNAPISNSIKARVHVLQSPGACASAILLFPDGLQTSIKRHQISLLKSISSHLSNTLALLENPLSMMFKSAAFFLLAGLAFASPIEPVPRHLGLCADVTVFFARGTTEPAPIGLIVGPPFQAALQTAIGGKTLSFIGVTYAADIPGFLEGGDPFGSAAMAADVNAAASACPNTAIVMSGYSQGAQLVHNAAKQLSSSVQNRVKAVVMYGDPDNGQALPGVLNSRSLTFCAAGDLICLGQDIILAPHLSYGADVGQGAAFVASKL